jgi:hypothetical protein
MIVEDVGPFDKLVTYSTCCWYILLFFLDVPFIRCLSVFSERQEKSSVRRKFCEV